MKEETQKAIGCIFAIIQILVLTPIWYYLMYQFLVYAKASETMWFLFWIYVPLALVLGIIKTVIEVIYKES